VFSNIFEALWIAVALMSGVLAIFREALFIHRPERSDSKRVFWACVRIAFILTAPLAWYGQYERANALSASNSTLAKSLEAQQTKADGREEKLNSKITAEQQNVRNREESIKNLEAEITNRDTQVNNRDRQVGIRDTQSSILQTQIRNQQQTNSDLLLQLQKAQQGEPLKVFARPIAVPQPNPKIAPYVTSFLLLANKDVTPVFGLIECDNAMADVQAISLAPGIITLEIRRMAPNAFRFQVDSPSLTPVSPLLFTMYYERDLGDCRFKSPMVGSNLH
jgi:hypothetical protein